jgi:hypothetical protein
MTKLVYEDVSSALVSCSGDLIAASKILNVNYFTLYSFVKRHNIPFISKKPPIPPKEKLEEAYTRLGSLSLVAKELGGTKEGIRRAMQRHGIEINPLVIHSCDHEFFSRDNEETFYLAGFIAADGCVKEHTNGNSYQLQIGLGLKDRDFLETLRQTMKAEAPIREFLIKNSKRNPKWNDTWKSEIIITSTRMFDDLKRFNVVPRKSLIYTFPEWMKTHSLKHHFIRGYNDGDGCFHVPKLAENRHTEQVYFSMRGTPEFLREVRDVLEKECDLEDRKKPIRISSGHGTLEYGGNGIIGKIVRFIYQDATIYLPRKYEIALKSM